MTTDLTTLLAEADAVSAAATPGPWSVDDYDTDVVIYMPEGQDQPRQWRYLADCGNAEGHGRANTAFIAASRDLIPRLVAACREHMAEIERLREALDTIATSFHGSNPSMAYADAPREAYLEHVLMEVRRFARAALQPAGKDTP